MKRHVKQILNYEPIVIVSSMVDIPEDVSKRIFLVERGGTLRWMVLQCPCGCGKRIDANLMRSKRPHWRVRRHLNGSITVMPSLWLSDDDCGSHFWIYRSRIVWVYDRLRSRRQRLQQMDVW